MKILSGALTVRWWRLLSMKTKKFQGPHLNNLINSRSPPMKRTCKIFWHRVQTITTLYNIMSLDPQWISIVLSTRLLTTEVPSNSCKLTRMGCPTWKISKLMSYLTWSKSSFVSSKNSKSKSIFSNKVRLSIQEWPERPWALPHERGRHSTRRPRNGFLGRGCPRTREVTAWWYLPRTAKEVITSTKNGILETTSTSPSQTSQVLEIQKVT